MPARAAVGTRRVQRPLDGAVDPAPVLVEHERGIVVEVHVATIASPTVKYKR